MSDPISPIRETVILVSFKGGFYNWKRRDRAAEREYAASKGVKKAGGWEAHKNIFLGADNLLASTKALITEARAYHYDHTTVSPYEGEAFIKNVAIQPYREAMTAFKHRLDALNDQIEAEWPTMIQTAKVEMNGTVTDSDFPSIEAVKQQNYIENIYRPIPDGANIILDGVDAELRNEIAADVDSRIADGFRAANKEAWLRLLQVLANAKDNLTKDTGGEAGSPRFRTEWHDNLAKLVDIMDGLNITNDPMLTQFTQQAEGLLQFDADTYKNNYSKRDAAGATAEQIYNDMNAYFGENLK